MTSVMMVTFMVLMNHKLIKWRFVIHGGIDGFSRAIVYIHCSTNNRGSTVKNLFVNAVSTYGFPLRVRCDHGTENIATAQWCLENLGTHDRPVITGLSVHNQRTERLWLDVGRCVIQHFKNLFIYLENSSVLDPVDEIDLAALELVYTPRINQSLEEFANQWNNHPLPSCHNKSPLQLIEIDKLSHSSIRDHDISDDGDFYGVDEYGPIGELQTMEIMESMMMEIMVSTSMNKSGII